MEVANHPRQHSCRVDLKASPIYLDLKGKKTKALFLLATPLPPLIETPFLPGCQEDFQSPGKPSDEHFSTESPEMADSSLRPFQFPSKALKDR